MSDSGSAQVMTTVFIKNDPHWSVITLDSEDVMIEDCSQRIGIVGSPQQIAKALNRMREALAHHIVNRSMEESANVN